MLKVTCYEGYHFIANSSEVTDSKKLRDFNHGLIDRPVVEAFFAKNVESIGNAIIRESANADGFVISRIENGKISHIVSSNDGKVMILFNKKQIKDMLKRSVPLKTSCSEGLYALTFAYKVHHISRAVTEKCLSKQPEGTGIFRATTTTGNPAVCISYKKKDKEIIHNIFERITEDNFSDYQNFLSNKLKKLSISHLIYF